MMINKLIIQIPCFNEADSLPITLAELPKSIEAVNKIEWMIIDDGSSDDTINVARRLGVKHIVKLPQHQGLARAFKAGLEASTKAGADIIVNTDADNQYCAKDIPKLIAPILSGDADLVIGSRPILNIQHFSVTKKLLQKLGSAFIRLISNTDIPDAPSGFRAMSRNAALQLNVFSNYTYTLETIIQAGQKNMAIRYVDVRVNGDMRPSRLVSSIPAYLSRSVGTAIRIFITYKPLKFFFTFGLISFLAGFLLAGRFLFYFIIEQSDGHVQSLILAAILILIGFLLFVVGIVADLISVNRRLLEKIDYKLQELESEQNLNRALQKQETDL